MSAVFPILKSKPTFGPFFGDLDRIFETRPIAREFHLSCDLVEETNAIHMHFDIPGVDEKQVHVEFDDGVLHVYGERLPPARNAKDEDRESHRTYKERRFGTFSRKFRLPKTVETASIKATHKNGVLSLELPKKEKAKPQKIEIHS